MTPGTSLWAIKQLLDGKKITCKEWKASAYLQLNNNKIVDEKNILTSIGIFCGDDATWQLWTPPNPYPTGTFPWAWEEMMRGNRVETFIYGEHHCYWIDTNGNLCKKCTDNTDANINSINVQLIKSTNWKLA